MGRERKPREWVRLDCQGVLHGSLNYIFELAEQAVFLKMIAMAEVYGPEPGLISDNEKKALPVEYVAHELHCPVEMLGSVIDKGKQDKSIIVNGNGIRLVNFPKYQFTEYERQRPYREKKKKKDNENKETYGEFKNVFLSATEYSKLIEKWGEQRTKEMIEIMSRGIQSKGYSYKDFYAALLNWERKEQNGRGTTGNRGHIQRRGMSTAELKESCSKPVE